MIIPARWYTNGKGAGIEKFRYEMMNDKRIKYLFDYKNTGDCFSGVNIGGGVCYFLIDSAYNGPCHINNCNSKGIYSKDLRYLDEFNIVVRDNLAIRIIRKCSKSQNLDSLVKSYNYFSIRSYERGNESRIKKDDVILLSSEGKGFYDRTKCKDKDKIIDRYKLVINYAMSGGNKPSKSGVYQVLSSLQILSPNEVCTETFLVINASDDLQKLRNIQIYLETKFFRFLLLQALTSIHITKDSFCFIPTQDFSKPWTDAELYEKYNLSQEEIDFIESMIKPMDLGPDTEVRNG